MKRSLSIICVFFIVFLLSGCGKSSFDGIRTGNDSQFVMKYKIFNTTDEQSLFLESGDTIFLNFYRQFSTVNYNFRPNSISRF